MIEILKKVDKVYEVSSHPSMSLVFPYTTFKKILMLYPADGPVISCERTIKEKYKCLKDFGILNQDGRLNYEEFTRWVSE